MAKRKESTQNAANAIEVRNAEDLDRRDQIQIEMDTRKVMLTPEGRRMIWWLLEKCGIHRSSMTGNSYTYFQEGERNIGLMMEAHLIEACDREYLKMQGESIERGKKRKLEIEALSKSHENEENT